MSAVTLTRMRELKRAARVRYRFGRRLLYTAKKRTLMRVRFSLLWFRNQAILQRRNVLTHGRRWMATTAGLMLAVLFAVTLPDEPATIAALKVSEVHLASAGIIGTALALVLSLSIVPSQKAADVFSPAILRLYARDRTTLGVFALLSCSALLSLFFGTGWTFSLGARYTLGGQFILMGASLDALRAFYSRALNLLDPATALKLVADECRGYIERIRDEIERVARLQSFTSDDGSDGTAFRYLCYEKSRLPGALNAWITQLEEFAHKGVARRDTLAVNAILQTMAQIGRNYAEARRSSMLLVPDFTGGMPLEVSDIGSVLNPIHESIKAICDHAAKQSNQDVVRGCIGTLGEMASHAMTMVHTADRHKTTPLAFSPIYYVELCIKPAIAAGMEDALLAAVEAVRKVFAKISDDTDSQSAEAKALDVLFSIAASSYPRNAIVSCFKSVEMMLLAAQHDIRVRGYRGVGSTLTTVLPNIAVLVPFEVAMEKAGQRMVQTFPPYSMTFSANLPTLLADVAQQVGPGECDRSWIDPFDKFNEASEAVVRHYREVAEKVSFDGVLLEKWVVESVIDAAESHIHLLDNPPEGAGRFLNSVDDRLRWFIHAPSFFFREQKEFPYYHASDACGRLAILGMALLQRQRIESAVACGEAIRSIAHRSAKAETSRSYTGHYGFADCAVKLEQLARAADAFGLAPVAVVFRGHGSRPDDISEEAWPEYVEAVQTRTRQMDEKLGQYIRGVWMPGDSVSVLREILNAVILPCGRPST